MVSFLVFVPQLPHPLSSPKPFEVLVDEVNIRDRNQLLVVEGVFDRVGAEIFYEGEQRLYQILEKVELVVSHFRR